MAVFIGYKVFLLTSIKSNCTEHLETIIKHHELIQRMHLISSPNSLRQWLMLELHQNQLKTNSQKPVLADIGDTIVINL